MGNACCVSRKAYNEPSKAFDIGNNDYTTEKSHDIYSKLVPHPKILYKYSVARQDSGSELMVSSPIIISHFMFRRR